MSRTITATVRQTTPTASKGEVRDHEVLIDRPKGKGGTDEGPMGGELLLLALGGCFMSNLLAAIRAREAAVTDASVEVAAELDGTPERMASFRLTVRAVCEDDELLRHLAMIAERGCLVSNTLRSASPIELQVEAVAAT